MDEERLSEFLEYFSLLKGSEKSEAQLFLEHLFKAFGHQGIIEAGATLEQPIKIDTKTKFCDLIWPGKVLIEMKTRGEKLEKHFIQANTYWNNAYGERTEYVILCNFDEFWIYNWNLQRDPLDKVPTLKLKKMWRSLAFLGPKDIKPIFGNNLVEVTKEAADKIAKLYRSLVERGINNKKAQRFTLQCLVALFAEDAGLFPTQGFFLDVIEDCKNGQSTFDLFTLLFERMNSKEPVVGGRFKDVKYFDGGIFSKINPIELNKEELDLLSDASKHDWSKVQPSIFGNIFEDSLDAKDRHTWGAHFTYESDIMRIVEPTVLRPWREKIASAKTLKELRDIKNELSKFKVLDPACGSGNFLYVSFRELKHLELALFQKILDKYPSIKPEKLHSGITTNQFYGIDTNSLGVELAKITLSMAKKFASDDFNKFTKQHRFFYEKEEPLPFDNLDENIIAKDALFRDWPKVDVIIGNPPYQSKNKMVKEFGPEYVEDLRDRYPKMPGRADYCVYWFRKAHDTLSKGGRAGLVGTNTIRQTYSRKGGLDYIVKNGGVITEAVSTMPWSGKAVVYVSIVNWIKGEAPKNRKFKLAIQPGDKKDDPWEEYKLPRIPSSLSPLIDVTEAKSLDVNKMSKACIQGQTHGHKGFLLTPEEKDKIIIKEPKSQEVIFPYLNAEELIGNVDSQPGRFIIDFHPRDSLSEVNIYTEPFNIIKEKVLPQMIENAEKEKEKYKDLEKKVNARQQHLNRWWLFWRPREDLIKQISKLPRYIVCGQVTKRPIFEFISSQIRPNAALIAFPLNDDYSFGILQSTIHWKWFEERCSTLKGDPRYTSTTVFYSFPWPQWGKLKTVKTSEKISKIELALNIAKAARELRQIRNSTKQVKQMTLRKMYRNIELPGKDPLKTAQQKLDAEVFKAYAYCLPKKMAKMDTLEFLLTLNEMCSNAEKDGKKIIGPGLPSFCEDDDGFYSDDCIKLLMY